MRALAAGVALAFVALLGAAVAVREGPVAVSEGPAGAPDAPATVTRPPTRLADGTRPPTLPVALRRFEGLPVVGARLVVRPAVPRWCGANRLDRRLTAWLSPDGLSIVYSDRRSALPRACDVVRVDSRWARCSVGIARSRDPARIARAGGALGVCTRRGRWRAFMWVASSPRAAWALVRRQRFWVAYRTSGARLIRISGSERGRRADRFRTTVVFLDGRGRVVERRRVVGAVAG